MKGFKLSPLHLPPVRRLKVKKTHYRVMLGCATLFILVVHYYAPEHETHVALAVQMLFVVDPTSG